MLTEDPPVEESAAPAETAGGDRDRLVDGLLLLAFVALFSIFAFEARYAPDFFVQVGYLEYLSGVEVNLLSSLANNSVLLDYVLYPAHEWSGLGPATTLKVFYVVVLVVKYAVLLKLFRSRAYVVALFLWGFFSFDVNQARLNTAWILAALLFLGRRKIALSAAMLATHLASAAILPVIATGWTLSKRQIGLVVAVSVVVGAYAMSSLEFTLDERFLDYLATDEFWVPKALAACPVMLLVLRDEYGRFTRAALIAMALLPVAVASFRLAIVSARLAEIVFAAFVMKLGIEGRPLTRGKTALLFVPGALMFLFRVSLGVNPSQ